MAPILLPLLLVRIAIVAVVVVVVGIISTLNEPMASTTLTTATPMLS